MRTVALILAVLVLFACELPKESRPEKEQMTASKNLDAIDLNVLWEIVTIEVNRSGFDIDQLKSSSASGQFESHWVNELAPFRYEGRRKKIVGMIEESPGRPGSYRVLLITWVQRNADLEDPLNPAKAIWQNADPDNGNTGQILYRIERHFIPMGSEGG
jgi:hypothetical protein